MCEDYLLQYHKDFIIDCMNHPDENKHFSLNINCLQLFENAPSLGQSLLEKPEQTLGDWNNAILKVQTKLLLELDQKFVVKSHIHCRIYQLPRCPELYRTILPKNDDANSFLEIRGTVARITAVKMLEYQRQYICPKCKYIMYVTAEYELKNMITTPKKCSNPEECNGKNLISSGELKAELCKDYQEIKIQESDKLNVGCMPSSMWVTLEDDLVDTCKPGDNVNICGVVKRRWGPFIPGKIIDIDLVFRANHVQVNNNNISTTSVTPELKDMFKGFWKTYCDCPLVARDIILKSICPQIFGLHLVKLAIAVVLAGGSRVQDSSNTGTRIRSEPHLLLVGDPGTGKSQLLKFASKIIPRSVLTTGVGSTAAGLTVTAIMENGEWQLEGGALVLADGGICCIDEFNSMKEHDRTSIHEAMEQQTISVAKASIVCKLSTKCSILAATNPKGNLDLSQPLCMNVALASPLLSRFDLILLLKDKVKDDWDALVADYILNATNETACKLTDNINWTIETLQAYFVVIKKINPVLTEDSNKVLAAYYQAQRRQNCRNKSRTTVRLLDSLVRLSQGHARLMYHTEVEIIDAVVAVMLVETAMEAEFSLFDLHFDVQNDFPVSPMASYKELVEIILKKLHLDDLLEKEVAALDNLSKKSVDVNQLMKRTKSVDVKRESKYFNVRTKSGEVSEKIVDNDLSKPGCSKDSRNEETSRFVEDNEGVRRGRITSEKIVDNNLGKPGCSKDFRNEGTTRFVEDIRRERIINDIEMEKEENENPQSSEKCSVNKRNKTKNKTNPKKRKSESVDAIMTDLQVLDLLKDTNDMFQFGDTEFCDESEKHTDKENRNPVDQLENSKIFEEPDFGTSFHFEQVQACSTFIESKKDKTEGNAKNSAEEKSASNIRQALKKFKFVPRDTNIITEQLPTKNMFETIDLKTNTSDDDKTSKQLTDVTVLDHCGQPSKTDILLCEETSSNIRKENVKTSDSNNLKTTTCNDEKRKNLAVLDNSGQSKTGISKTTVSNIRKETNDSIFETQEDFDLDF